MKNIQKDDCALTITENPEALTKRTRGKLKQFPWDAVSGILLSNVVNVLMNQKSPYYKAMVEFETASVKNAKSKSNT